MKIMIDTNIFISAALFPNGLANAAFIKALTPPYEPVVCDYIVDELHRKFKEKFSEKQEELEAFLQTALLLIRVIPTPSKPVLEENKIRDIKDRPILRAALNEGVEYFLTGDKDFLESSISFPIIISVRDFLNL